MKKLNPVISRPAGWLMIFLLSLIGNPAGAHPMPNSVVLLTIHANRIDAEIQIPLNELQAAYGHAVNDSSTGLISRLGPQLRAYLTQHIRPQSPDGKLWEVSVDSLSVHTTENLINGEYRELVAQVRLFPAAGADLRQFRLYYDVVVHQVVTHQILVSIRQDWAQGQLEEETPIQVGTISLDIPNNIVPPLNINLEKGSFWSGVGAMVGLGMRHIGEGTDHLLFLLVLLLPAPLLVTGRRWGSFGGIRYCLARLLWIVTAFTIGHSLTLILGALGWVRLPGQLIEVLIALSILVSAIHALRPLFPGKEAWVGAGFGLVHGLAFAGTLVNLQLDAGPMVLSILGFNLGIEIMQLFVIALTIPWLILLSQTRLYPIAKGIGAILAGTAAVAWMIERVSGEANGFTAAVEKAADWAPWLLAVVATVAIVSWFQGRNQPSSRT